jgi:sphingolipid delta-4 desaturase
MGKIEVYQVRYIHSEQADPHVQRRKDMLRKYPEALRALMGNHPKTALWVVGAVTIQFAMAALVHDQAGWVIALAAFGIGAVVNHALYVFIHEAAHNLIFRSSNANRWIGMVCDFALVAPGAMAFRKFHLIHHFKMGQLEHDADLTSDLEGKLVGKSAWRKAIWVFLLGVSQAMRPMRIGGEFWDRWMLANLALQAVVVTALVLTLGWGAIAYLLASSVFGLGIHPLGGRWIAEHYVTTPGYETYSYYGPANIVAFNVGFHNEHHDIMTIPWVNLPKMRKIAPEFYDTLPSYRSYTRLLVRFITDPTLTLFSRVTRSSSRSVEEAAS